MATERLSYVFLLPKERFGVLVHITGIFERVELDFEDGGPPQGFTRQQLATPGRKVKIPDDEQGRSLHVQLLRATAAGSKGPLLIWRGDERLLAFLEGDDGTTAQLVAISDVSAFRKPGGGLDEALARSDANAMLELVQRVQKGFRPGEAE